MTFNRCLAKPWMMVLLFAALSGAATAGEQGPGNDTRIPFPKPESHRAKWLEYHGREVAALGMSANRPGTECTTCHERNDCTACHTMQAPRDHGNFWRTRGHGLSASGNRDRCLACHRQDYCVRCHSETAPRTHTASWRSRHCGGCHFASNSVPADNCNVCHKRALHVSAPHPVNPAVDCSHCHK
ncbi:MAG: hypothetical protein OEW15_06375 [Nitrospirota bacterium]|nr:hypothetical protein [Nitrospirota bacterium]